ncbi:MAG TPA: hypothetical protein H9830_13985 [Candidatus Agrococcus pullicola]|uniref:Uncharacterized protein n=1 Tax=Candidatus Agrococcus pullicola TaxID=2838429 RepID=A0A9D1YX30_9MICO|nr:hypothetical protein [Candidatus Agrococcus pullicola]
MNAGPRQWTSADAALWHAISIVNDLRSERVPVQRVSTAFPIAPDEVAFAGGPFTMDSMRALGDGSYVHDSSFVFGTGAFGLAMTAGTLFGSAVGNAQRRSQAASDAQIAWRPDFGGTITVTSRGFYLATNTGLFRWTWDAIQLAEMDAFTVLVMQGQSEGGPVTWRMTSDWSELVFALWALSMHPDHPQFATDEWIPQNWIAWAASVGYPVPPSTAIES